MSEPKLMANSLRPCCGNEIPHSYLMGETGGRSLWAMWCKTCLKGVTGSSIHDAMEQWNTRHSATEGIKLAAVMALFQQVQSWKANGLMPLLWPDAVNELYEECRALAETPAVKQSFTTQEADGRG